MLSKIFGALTLLCVYASSGLGSDLHRMRLALICDAVVVSEAPSGLLLPPNYGVSFYSGTQSDCSRLDYSNPNSTRLISESLEQLIMDRNQLNLCDLANPILATECDLLQAQ